MFILLHFNSLRISVYKKARGVGQLWLTTNPTQDLYPEKYRDEGPLAIVTSLPLYVFASFLLASKGGPIADSPHHNP